MSAFQGKRNNGENGRTKRQSPLASYRTMVNFNASVNSNNTALRKDSAGNASRNRLKDRRSERALEDTAAETARLLALKEEIDAENRATEGGSKEEMKQLNKDLRESKRRVSSRPLVLSHC